MKILDRYILTTFLKTFFPLFIIIMFILLLQTIWLFISELAGKDLDFSVIMKFLTFAIPRLIPMVLPLTILLTSIMTFGNFAENYEFAAMKSSGISLQRAMRTLSIFIFFVGIGAFLFSNTVIPESEKRFVNLRKNIVKVKPASVITPNQFTDLGDINIKVAEKHGDNDQYLRDVIIHKKANRPGNFTVIKAVDGELQGSIDSDLITLLLNDGNYYDDVQQRSPKERKKHPFAKMHFKQYVLNLDLSELDNVDMDAQQYSKGFNMLNVNQLKHQIDTISIQVNNEVRSTHEEINRRGGYIELNRNLKIDTIQNTTKDTLDLINDRFTTRQKSQIYNLAYANTDGVIRKLKSTKKSIEIKKRGLNKYEMSLHDKYVLGIACIVLFFVGAPLGAIIRKGGLGLPIVIGVLLFLTYHFIGIFAKNGAEEGGIPPFLGSWLSTFIIFPLSILLTYRATTDRGFFSLDNFVDPIRNFFQKRTISNDNGETSSLITNIHTIDIDDITKRNLEKNYARFIENSHLVIALFIILIVVNGTIYVISKEYSSTSSMGLYICNGLGLFTYLYFFFTSFKNFNTFYRDLSGLIKKPSTLLFLSVGVPLYILAYLYYKKRMTTTIESVT